MGLSRCRASGLDGLGFGSVWGSSCSFARMSGSLGRGGGLRSTAEVPVWGKGPQTFCGVWCPRVGGSTATNCRVQASSCKRLRASGLNGLGFIGVYGLGYRGRVYSLPARFRVQVSEVVDPWVARSCT